LAPIQLLLAGLSNRHRAANSTCRGAEAAAASALLLYGSLQPLHALATQDEDAILGDGQLWDIDRVDPSAVPELEVPQDKVLILRRDGMEWL